VCGRFTLATTTADELRQRWPLGESVEIAQRFNVAPGDQVVTVGVREGVPTGRLLRWGLVPPWARDPSIGYRMINARAETVAEKPAFRTSFARRRCLILADGFYEWRRLPAGPKQAFHIARADGSLFAFAGLWSIWHGEDGATLRTCTILTTGANSAIASLHDRMPVILAPDAELAWLEPTGSPARLPGLLGGLDPAGTSLRPVGPAVNDARYDGPECLAPALDERQPALF
jgi:putative SOS response-associated peptidase YedK